MLYPILKFKRCDDRDESRHAEEFLMAADSIAFVAPLTDGGSRVYSAHIPDDEASGGLEDDEPYIDVTYSPSQIQKAIQDAISGAAELQTMGAIRMNVKAQSELSSKPTIARPFNGG